MAREELGFKLEQTKVRRSPPHSLLQPPPPPPPSLFLPCAYVLLD